MASLGQELKRERELRGISLKEIADSTRISLKFLQALEEDRLDIIPGQFFVRAILRSYAKCVGLDENQWLNKYQEMLLFEEYELDKHPHKRLSPPLVLTPKRLIILLVVLVVVVITALSYFVFISPGQSSAPPPKAQPQAVLPPPPARLVEVPPQELAVEEIKGLSLDISFLEETWAQIYADGKVVWDGIKNRGDTLQVKAEQELVLNLGNAGGLTFTINGKKAKPFGPMGAVRKDIRITLDNYQSYLLPEEETKG
jgi:transcriptional regulator with XRE-family HTH domain